MSSLRPNRVEVVTSAKRRRRWTPEQKLEIVKQTNEPGSSVSLVARQHGLTSVQLFQWRKADLEGSLVAVGAKVTVVQVAGFQEDIRRIKQLKVALYRKTLKNEFLAVISNSAVDGKRRRSGGEWESVVPEAILEPIDQALKGFKAPNLKNGFFKTKPHSSPETLAQWPGKKSQRIHNS
jgi:transposase